MDYINLVGVRQHNLKNISLRIPRRNFVVITGVSGSGKSSLAFDTIFAEGQRRFMESLSAYARQFVEKLDKPDFDSIEGLSPSISVDQKSFQRNPRSTVGTITEIYDFLRLLFARLGTPYCYKCGHEIVSQSVDSMAGRLIERGKGKKVSVYSPIVQGRKGEYRKELDDLRKEGFVRVRIDGEIYDLDEEIKLSRQKRHTIEVLIDIISVKGESSRKRIEDALGLALQKSGSAVRCEVGKDSTINFSKSYSCPDCGTSYPEISPRLFSFNSPYGACEKCGGMGSLSYFDPELIVEDDTKSIKQGAIRPWKNSKYYNRVLNSLSKEYGFSLDTPFRKLDKSHRDMIFYGTGNVNANKVSGKRKKSRKSDYGYRGLVSLLDEWYKETDSDEVRESLSRYIRSSVCSECSGARLREESLSIYFKGENIHHLAYLPVDRCLEFFQQVELTVREELVGRKVVTEIISRLTFLKNVGLGYISLDRAAPTLSGGESQRIRLATQVGSELTGITYVLDEPSIGLHPRDNKKLIDTLMMIRDSGNTVIVVEHDEETIRSSDYVVDMGPGAGENGGEVIATGDICSVLCSEKSLTGKYLKGELSIDVPAKRRKPKGFVKIKGAEENNLRKIDVSFPLGVFTCVTGVSGSGKSTLVIDTFYNALAKKLYRSTNRVGRHAKIIGADRIQKIIDVDQTPIGRTPRSNPATYTGVFTPLRVLFSMLPQAKVKGYTPGRFSFNVKEGSCSYCKGQGIVKIEMHFLPDVYVTCEQCGGKRYNEETLAVKYRGKNISDVLDMTVGEAAVFFGNVPKVKDKLDILSEIGLEYIRLGQQATTVSGGEAQRIKLAKELSRRSKGNTIYILDEPTVGLHFDDVKKLLGVINRLVDQGDTVIVIEHHLDVIKSADHIIDLGPEGGEDGGEVVAAGTPEKVARINRSHTAGYLKDLL